MSILNVLTCSQSSRWTFPIFPDEEAASMTFGGRYMVCDTIGPKTPMEQ